MSIKILTKSLPVGHVGEAYSCQLSAETDPIAPIFWTSQLDLPTYLYLDAERGKIEGKCHEEFHGAAQMVATNMVSGEIAVRTYDLSIEAAEDFKITTSSLPVGRVGALYSQVIEAQGGTPPYLWRGIDLPEGLAMSEAVVSGVPKVAGTFTVHFVVEDSGFPPRATFRKMPLTVGAKPIAIGDRLQGGVVFQLDAGGHAGAVVSDTDIGGPTDWPKADDACKKLELNGYSNWTLPNQVAWNAIMSNLIRPGLLTFPKPKYWTADAGYGPRWHRAVELSKNDYFPIEFDASPYAVRAVRLFS